MGAIHNLWDLFRELKDFRKNRNFIEFHLTQEHPSIDQIVKLLHGVVPGLSDVKIVQAFYLSKMVV